MANEPEAKPRRLDLLRTWTRWLPVRLAIYFLVFIAVYSCRSSGEIVTQLTAQTERLSVVVDSEALSALRLHCATVRSREGTIDVASGVLDLPLGSRWTAVALPDDQLFVRVATDRNDPPKPVSIRTPSDDASASRSVPLPLTVRIDARACADQRIRLQVHGQVEVGDELKSAQPGNDPVQANAPYLLREGSLRLRLELPLPGSQHFAQLDDIALQPGSRFVGGVGGDSGTVATWTGFADLEPGGVLSVRLASTGRGFRVLSESAGSLEGASIGINFFTLVGRDPVLTILLAFFGFLETVVFPNRSPPNEASGKDEA
jgi:hypothetical protein